jgi:hypothetical protein
MTTELIKFRTPVYVGPNRASGMYPVGVALKKSDVSSHALAFTHAWYAIPSEQTVVVLEEKVTVTPKKTTVTTSAKTKAEKEGTTEK